MADKSCQICSRFWVQTWSGRVSGYCLKGLCKNTLPYFSRPGLLYPTVPTYYLVLTPLHNLRLSQFFRYQKQILYHFLLQPSKNHWGEYLSNNNPSSLRYLKFFFPNVSAPSSFELPHLTRVSPSSLLFTPRNIFHSILLLPRLLHLPFHMLILVLPSEHGDPEDSCTLRLRQSWQSHCRSRPCRQHRSPQEHRAEWSEHREERHREKEIGEKE